MISSCLSATILQFATDFKTSAVLGDIILENGTSLDGILDSITPFCMYAFDPIITISVTLSSSIMVV